MSAGATPCIGVGRTMLTSSYPTRQAGEETALACPEGISTSGGDGAAGDRATVPGVLGASGVSARGGSNVQKRA